MTWYFENVLFLFFAITLHIEKISKLPLRLCISMQKSYRFRGQSLKAGNRVTLEIHILHHFGYLVFKYFTPYNHCVWSLQWAHLRAEFIINMPYYFVQLNDIIQVARFQDYFSKGEKTNQRTFHRIVLIF